MASADLARGQSVATDEFQFEIQMFLLVKEFNWTPSQIRQQNYKDMKAFTTMLSVFNRVKNNEMEKLNRKK